MRVYLKVLIYILLVTHALPAQESATVGWLSELQAWQDELTDGRSGVEAQRRGEIASKFRELYSNFRQRLRGRTLPGVELPTTAEGESHAELLAAMLALREYREESERRTPGGVFNLGRIEMNVEEEAGEVTATIVTCGRYLQNQGGRFGRATNYALAGVGTTVKVYQGMDFQAGVANLLDRNYLLQDGYPETGCSGYVNLRYRF